MRKRSQFSGAEISQQAPGDVRCAGFEETKPISSGAGGETRYRPLRLGYGRDLRETNPICKGQGVLFPDFQCSVPCFDFSVGRVGEGAAASKPATLQGKGLGV